MPCCKISDCAQMSKTIIAVRHFGLGGRESLETAVTLHTTSHRLRIHKDDACTTIPLSCMVFNKSLNKDKNQFSSVV